MIISIKSKMGVNKGNLKANRMPFILASGETPFARKDQIPSPPPTGSLRVRRREGGGRGGREGTEEGGGGHGTGATRYLAPVTLIVLCGSAGVI